VLNEALSVDATHRTHAGRLLPAVGNRLAGHTDDDLQGFGIPSRGCVEVFMSIIEIGLLRHYRARPYEERHCQQASRSIDV